MSLGILDIVIITIGAVMGVTALTILVLKVEEEKKDYKKYSSFLSIGGTWFIIGLILGVFYRGTGVLYSPLLSSGLIFLFAGSIGVIKEYLKHTASTSSAF